MERHAAARASRTTQSNASWMDRLLQSRTGSERVSIDRGLHAQEVSQMVDASTRSARHRVSSVSGRVSLQDSRSLQAATETQRPGECEGWRNWMRAGCGKSARPVRRAGTGNGTTVRIEAPALGESRRTTATPLGLWSPRLSSTLPIYASPTST